MDELEETIAQIIADATCERPWPQLSDTAKIGALRTAHSVIAAINASGTHVVVPASAGDREAKGDAQ